MGKKEIEIIIGKPTYPKAEALIIAANTKGTMNKGVPYLVSKEGLGSVIKESKVKAKTIEVGGCFSTSPGRLNKRGLKRIYHAVIRRFCNDFTSLYIIQKALEESLLCVIRDNYKTVAVSGLGLERNDVERKNLAQTILSTCEKYSGKLLIKIISEDNVFISVLSELYSKESES